MQQTLTSAYIFHPKVETREADKQMFMWTKSIPIQIPPSSFTKLMNDVDLEPMRRIMETTFLVSRLYEKREVKRKSKKKPLDLTKGTHEHYPQSLLQNQFKNVIGFSKHYPQLRNLNPASEASVSATWKVQGEVLSVHGKPGVFLNSKKPQPVFYEQDLVDKAMEFPVNTLAEPVSPFTDLKKYLIKETACTGLFTEKTLFPHFHTLLIVDNGDYIPPPSRAMPAVQLIQKGVLFTFTRLLAQAITKHGNEIVGQVLPEPECGQCIVTDGDRFSFIWFQLNTLDMNDLGSGVKNLLHIHRPDDTFIRVKKDVQQKHVLDGFREDILKLYLSMLLMSS
jgi:hypothetical protein